MFVINYWDLLILSFSWHTFWLEAGGAQLIDSIFPSKGIWTTTIWLHEQTKWAKQKKNDPEHYP